MGKKDWNKPELIVLIQGKTEERVLANCKTSSVGGLGANSTNFGCYISSTNCAACTTIVTS